METTSQEQTAATAAAEATSPPTDIESLQKELAAAQAKTNEYLDGWQRARADFANYKKRQEQQISDLRAFATIDLLKRLLPIADDFVRAQKTLPEGISHMTWIEGIMLVQRKLELLLESEGVKPIETKQGDTFNPTIHEAVTHDDVPEGTNIESGHIIEELQKGYKIGERIIRPALVRVAK